MAAMVGEILLLDTNILLIATDRSRQLHRLAVRLFEEADIRGIHLAANGQVMREYLAVSTRPVEANGLGLGVAAAVANLGEFLKVVSLFDETESVALRLRRLVAVHGIRGKRVHDAGIVATMLAHRINFLVTQNGDDFAPFDEIDVLALEDVLSRTKPE